MTRSEILDIRLRHGGKRFFRAHAALAIGMAGENAIEQRIARLPIGIAHLKTQARKLAVACAFDFGRIEMRFGQRLMQQIERGLPFLAQCFDIARQRIASGLETHHH